MSSNDVENALRVRSQQGARLVEIIVYMLLGVLLAAGAAATLVAAFVVFWDGIRKAWVISDTYTILEPLLLAFIFVEILHTVRISLRSESLATEPFLIVGLIASVRRVLVITTQAAKAMEHGLPESGTAAIFRNSMIELVVLGALILVFVISIFLLRRSHRHTHQVQVE